MTETNIGLAISNLVCAAVCTALAVPLLRGRIKPNHLYGVRFSKSFESDELWYAINRDGARRLLRWSAVVAAIGVACLFIPLEGRPVLTVALGCAPLLYVVGAIASYRYAKRL